jgi:hypothetical protein
MTRSGVGASTTWAKARMKPRSSRPNGGGDEQRRFPQGHQPMTAGTQAHLRGMGHGEDRWGLSASSNRGTQQAGAPGWAC